ncbi:hypothetical protein NM688_g9283 [Phlebia brevispora]|uniref:Uncharacterized protein n=1 Tax=Phlebia brevispora TaxID=194682 RepID=A0ACC1RK03_9APHY|nr:hypothetical protein NM688_g9283 [Phlebia brevispora]
MQFVLPLNDTQLVFLPGDATGLSEIYAAQVTIKSSQAQNVNILCAYMLDQRDITELAVKLVITHIRTPLPAHFTISGDRYTVTATHKRWNYGKKLQMKWGETKVKPCKDKWTFVFCPEGLKDERE